MSAVAISQEEFGAPRRGNRNAWRYGDYSAERKAELRAVRELLAELRNHGIRPL